MCWNSAFHAQGSIVILIIVQVGTYENIVVATMEALRKKERQDEIQLPPKIDGFLSFTPIEC